MTERISEAELREAEQILADHGDGYDMGPESWGRYVRELRRLRGLIGAMHGVEVDGTFGGEAGSGGCIYCVSCGRRDHNAESCPTDALEAEAKAIAEET